MPKERQRAAAQPALPAQERLIRAAADLFHEAGIVATSVDDVVAAAGVSKPTLYAKFASKTELLLAALRCRDESRRDVLRGVVHAAGGDPAGRILAVFDWLAQWLGADTFRGCALVNAAAEVGGTVPGAAVIAARHKEWVWRVFRGLAAEAGLAAPRELASALVLLMEGATTMALLGRGREAGREARAAAETLIAAHGAARRGKGSNAKGE